MIKRRSIKEKRAEGLDTSGPPKIRKYPGAQPVNDVPVAGMPPRSARILYAGAPKLMAGHGMRATQTGGKGSLRSGD